MMRCVEIRPYEPSDLEACPDLYTQLVEHHREIYDDPSIGADDPAGFDNYLALPERVATWVAVDDNSIVGLAGLLWTQGGPPSSPSSWGAIDGGPGSDGASSPRHGLAHRGTLTGIEAVQQHAAVHRRGPDTLRRPIHHVRPLPPDHDSIGPRRRRHGDRPWDGRGIANDAQRYENS